MDIYLVSFNSSKPLPVVREIAHMVDGSAGMRVFTNLAVYSTNRTTVKDYENMIAFSFPAVRSYKLKDLPIYIDDNYTTVYYAKHDLYAVFKRDLSHNVWNLVRPLLPSPDAIMNCPLSNHDVYHKGVMYVDTSAKPAIFDVYDVCISSIDLSHFKNYN